jgi:hypothetical protein
LDVEIEEASVISTGLLICPAAVLPMRRCV